MRNHSVRGYSVRALFAVLLLSVLFVTGQAMAQTSSSPNYQITESEFGNASGQESCSGNYCTTISIGDDGQSSSAASPELGTVEYGEPMIELSVESGSSNLGKLTTETTGTKTMSVKIRNFESGGYRLMIIGDPPKYGDHTLATTTSPEASDPGTEQFGINVVANTTPSVGTDPTNQPSGTSALGLIKTNYSQANMFMYTSGDVIAETQTNTGGADFTVTMIVNISNTTPAGNYSGDFAAVVYPYF